MKRHNSSAFSSLLLLLFPFHIAAQQSCYGQTGGLFEQHTPCFPNQTHSSCCLTTSGEHPDVCLDSGLCLTYGGMVFQGGCTDDTYSDAGCSDRCPRPGMAGWDELDPKPAFWNIMMCASGTYCCRFEHETNDCCSDNLNTLSIEAPLGMPIAATTQTSTDCANPSASASADSSETSGTGSLAGTTQCDDNDSTIIALGAGLGAGLGTLLAISTAFLIWQCRRNTHLKNELNEYRYLPKPGSAMTAANGGGFPAPASTNAYSDSATPTTLRSPENPLRPATWKTFLGKTAEVNGQREEAAGREVLELPVNTARPPGSPAANSAAPRQFHTSSEGSTL